MTLMRRPPRTVLPMGDLFDRWFNDRWLFGDGDGDMGRGPSIDVRETDDAYVIEADLPGVKPSDIDVTVEGRTLTLRGHAGSEREQRNEGYLMRERSSGAFMRTITLPGQFDANAVSSEYADGELRITLPKAAETRARRIDVKTVPTIEASATPAAAKK